MTEYDETGPDDDTAVLLDTEPLSEDLRRIRQAVAEAVIRHRDIGVLSIPNEQAAVLIDSIALQVAFEMSMADQIEMLTESVRPDGDPIGYVRRTEDGEDEYEWAVDQPGRFVVRDEPAGVPHPRAQDPGE